MRNFFKISKVVPSIATNAAKSNIPAIKNIHTLTTKEEQEKEEREKEKFKNLPHEDIDHFGDEDFYINPKFAKELEERWGTKIDIPDASIKVVNAEKLENFTQQSQSK